MFPFIYPEHNEVCLMGRTWQWSMFIVCLLLGMLFTQQIKSERKYRVNLPTRRVSDLADMLSQQEGKRKSLEEELMKARTENAIEFGNPEIDKLQTLLGYTRVEGPGILLEVDDSKRALAKNEDPADLLVHYDNLAMVVNELWNAGAEAICVNDERVVMDSGFSCAGTTILLNTRRIAPPYVIKAIGDPAGLEQALNAGVMGDLKYYELRVSLSQQDNLLIPAYKGIIQQRFSSPSEIVVTE